MLLITPDTSTETEYAPFSISYTVSDDTPMAPVPELTSVTVTRGVVDYLPYLTFVQDSLSSFTISGTLSDVFDREMTFLDANDVTGVVTKFADIPLDFNTLYRYKGATSNSAELAVTATTTSGVVVATITVNNNWTTANAMLVEYVLKGKF